VLVEGDGSRRKPLKAWNATEPVIPLWSDVAVCLVPMRIGATVDDELAVNYILHRNLNLEEMEKSCPQAAAYLKIDLNQIACNMLIHLYLQNTAESLQRAKDFKAFIKQTHPALWREFHYKLPMSLIFITPKPLLLWGNRIVRKRYGY
jgi:hypothetical protein